MDFVYNGDNDIYLLRLRDRRSGNYVLDATVVGTIYDAAGVVVIGTVTLTLLEGGGPITIYDAPSTGQDIDSPGGNYRGTKLAAVNLKIGTRYKLRVLATSGGSQWQDGQVVTCREDSN